MAGTGGSARLDSLKHDVAALLDTSKLQNVLLSLFEDLVKQGDRVQIVDENHQKLFSYCKESVEMLDERIQKVAGQMGDGQKSQLARFETRLTAMDEEVQERLVSVERKVHHATDLVESEVEERFAMLENKTTRVDAMERELDERLAAIEGKLQRVDEVSALRHSEMKEALVEFQTKQAWNIAVAKEEKSKAETQAADARRLAMEAEEAVAAERQRRLKDRETQLEKERMADEAAAIERQRRRAEREAELEKERLLDEQAAADRKRQRDEREAELERERYAEERLAEGYADVQRQRQDQIVAVQKFAEKRAPRQEKSYLEQVVPVNELLELARGKPNLSLSQENIREERPVEVPQVMDVELMRQASLTRPQPQMIQKPLSKTPFHGREPPPPAGGRHPTPSPITSPYGSMSVPVPSRQESRAGEVQEAPNSRSLCDQYLDRVTQVMEPGAETRGKPVDRVQLQLQGVERNQERWRRASPSPTPQSPNQQRVPAEQEAPVGVGMKREVPLVAAPQVAQATAAVRFPSPQPAAAQLVQKQMIRRIS